MGAQLIALNSAAGFWGLIILTLWQQVGYMMIIYIAGLQSIPSDYIEAAKVDGATAWQTFWKVKIPNLMPTITHLPVPVPSPTALSCSTRTSPLPAAPPRTPPRCSP